MKVQDMARDVVERAGWAKAGGWDESAAINLVADRINEAVAAETAACIALVEEAGCQRFWPTAARDFARLLRERLPKTEPLPQAAPLPPG